MTEEELGIFYNDITKNVYALLQNVRSDISVNYKERSNVISFLIKNIPKLSNYNVNQIKLKENPNSNFYTKEQIIAFIKILNNHISNINNKLQSESKNISKIPLIQTKSE
jgi:hypothetical protein